MPTITQTELHYLDGTGSWTSFTPTVTLVGGAGNTVPVYTTNNGYYWQLGGLVMVQVLLDGDGGAEGAGTGQFNVALPVAANANNQTHLFPCGTALNGASNYNIQGLIAGSATTIALSYDPYIQTFNGVHQNNTSRRVRLQFFYCA